MTNHVTESVVRAVAKTGGTFRGEPDDTPQQFVTALVAEGWTPPAPPPLTDEPTDLAARVIDRDGDLWAYDPKVGKWASVSTAARPWVTLAADYAPLHLWEPSGE